MATPTATTTSKMAASPPLLENRDEYETENVFWVPPEAYWAQIEAQVRRPEIAKLIDDAMWPLSGTTGS